jgi:hypothetical protein
MTGTRRKGTTISDLKELFTNRITAEAIEEPLQCCDGSDSACEIANRMHRLGFDFIGIKKPDLQKVAGYLNAHELTAGLCEEHQHKFELNDLISNSTPLINVLPILRDKERVFVLSGDVVTGIITRADLQKPPVRILLFGLVSLLEIHLTNLIRKHYPDDTWKTELKGPRLTYAEKVMKERVERNENLDLIDCLQFCDKRGLVTGHSEIRKILCFESKKSGVKVLESVESVRNKLAHSQDIADGTTWEEVIDLAEKIEKLIERAEYCLVFQEMEDGMRSTILP